MDYIDVLTDLRRINITMKVTDGRRMMSRCSSTHGGRRISDGGSSGALAPPMILGTWSLPKPFLEILCIYVLSRRS